MIDKKEVQLRKENKRLLIILIVFSAIIFFLMIVSGIRYYKIEKLEAENSKLLESYQVLLEKIHGLQIERQDRETYFKSLEEMLLVRAIEIRKLTLNNTKLTSILEAMQVKLEETTNCCDGDFVPYIIEKLKEFREWKEKKVGEK